MKFRPVVYICGALAAGVSYAQQIRESQGGGEEAAVTGSLFTACTDPALDGLAVVPSSLSYSTTSSYATREDLYKGNYVLENGTLRFDVPGGAVYQVSVDRVQIAGTPVLGFQNNKSTQQMGFSVRQDGDGLLRFESQIWFWLCQGAAYPAGNSIAFLRDDTFRSECKPINLRWRPLRPEPVYSSSASPSSSTAVSTDSFLKNKVGRIRDLDEDLTQQGLGASDEENKRHKVGAQRFAKLGGDDPGRQRPEQRVKVTPVAMTPQRAAKQYSNQKRSVKGTGKFNKRRSKEGL